MKKIDTRDDSVVDREDEIVDLGAASEITLGDFFPGQVEAPLIPDHWDS